MFKVLGILGISLVIVLKEVPSLKKQGKKKEIWVFSILQFIATLYFSLVLLNVKILSPLEVIRIIYKPISDALFSWLS